jgi:hypothetical protein
MADSPMKDHPLGQAARYNDADAEEHGLVKACAMLGLHLPDVMYIAEQRAIRVVMLSSGRFESERRPRRRLKKIPNFTRLPVSGPD